LRSQLDADATLRALCLRDNNRLENGSVSWERPGADKSDVDRRRNTREHRRDDRRREQMGLRNPRNNTETASKGVNRRVDLNGTEVNACANDDGSANERERLPLVCDDVSVVALVNESDPGRSYLEPEHDGGRTQARIRPSPV
jgi:hypothetical protein